jgi:beta-lactamase class D
MRTMALVSTVCAAIVFGSSGEIPARQLAATPKSCFILYDEQDGRTTRQPSEACSTRTTPASTFKIPHALAALDAGIVSGAHDTLVYDGSPLPFDRWKHDHDLASAMRDSVVWYFQRIAERMGIEREREYLRTFDYGNQDASGPLTSFWLGDSLQVSPEEQLTFLRRFFEGRLPVREDATRTVREILVQPEGRIVNAAGEHSFAAPWPEGTTLYAKTGSGEDQGRRVVWLVGRVERGDRAWVFVSCVLGSEEPMAAVNLAARHLVQRNAL